MKKCVYGGHYGSEGKGSLAEYYASKARRCKLIVAGENSPNSGHTTSRGSTRSIPASSFWADVILLGPDTVIDEQCLKADIASLQAQKVSSPIYIHENAAWLVDSDRAAERQAGLIEAVSSTGSGTGNARVRKQFRREVTAILSGLCSTNDLAEMFGYPVRVFNSKDYLSFVERRANDDWVFECSQGTLLDINFGHYPFCTSRSTLPRVAIERNGLGSLAWEFCGVFRTYPIRTGGPSGPTGGGEIKFAELGVPEEIASVTQRVRRIFNDDESRAVKLSRS